MKVRTLINKLLNYDMDLDVELVIYGDDEERFSCTLKDDCIEEHRGLDYCAIIFHSNELKDDDESIQDLIGYKHSLDCAVDINTCDKLNDKVNKLKISTRSLNGLLCNNIKYIGELVKTSGTELLKNPNFGRKSLAEVENALKEHSLFLNMHNVIFNRDNIIKRKGESK
jgi:hypothetical protein